MSSDRQPGAVALVGAVLAVAVLAAAVGGAWRLQERHWRGIDLFGRPGVPSAAQPTPSGWASTPITTNPHPMNLSWVVPVAITLGVLLTAFVLWRLWRRYRASGIDKRGAHEVGAVLTLPTEPEIPVLRRGAVAAQRLLDDIADPDNAIVAAWLALEEAAASSGVDRRPAETPTEFTVDVLGSTSADPAATRELLGLYHRARFSAAGVTRADVAAASACLAVLARDWAAMTAETVSTAVDRTEPGPGR